MQLYGEQDLGMMSERLEADRFRKSNKKTIEDREMKDILADGEVRVKNKKKFHRKNKS